MSSSSLCRVFIVDDHQLVADGLKTMIERDARFCVVGVAPSGEEGFRGIVAERPDIAIIDISLKDFSGLELLRRLRERGINSWVLVLSMYDEAVYGHRVRAAGADGYLMKEAAGEHLLSALQVLLRRGKYFSDSKRAPNFLVEPGVPLGVDLLTARELEIFQYLGRGMETREIAVVLQLSPKTIDAHCANIKTKLGLHHFTALLHCATLWESRKGAL